MSKLHVLQNINSLLNRFGYNLNITKMNKIRPTDKLQINIGSGDWECDGWVNLDYPSEYYSKWQKKHKIIPYDICNDSIPFKDDSVDAIYCSHVVEHIENEHIQRMFRECYRVLKRGGVLRIATPDAEFIYNISKWENEYWTWRNDWFSDTNFYTGQEPTQLEYLVREIATPKLLGYKGSIYNTIQYNTIQAAYKTMGMNDFFEFLTSDLSFRNGFEGDHINYWTFDKMKKMLNLSGFEFVVRSRYGASCCDSMRNKNKFDTTFSQMSLYVEAIKYPEL